MTTLEATRSDAGAGGSSKRLVDGLGIRDVGRAELLFIALPIAVMATLLTACYAADVDVATSRLFFCPETDCWPLADHQPWSALYHYGCRPSVWLGVSGLVVGLASFVVQQLKPYRAAGMFLALTLAVGPGIIVNAVLKPGVGRPRPCQTTTFGGEQQFSYFAGEGLAANKSFPSGHASMGYYMMTPALLLYRRRTRLAAAVLTAGAAYGVMISFARVAQGAHFTTDVVASALIVYVSGALVLAFIRGWQAYFKAAEPNGDPIAEGAILAWSDHPTRPAVEPVRKAA